MNRNLLFSLTAWATTCLGVASAAELSSQLQALQGDWSTTKTNRDGERYTQSLRIDQDRLAFAIAGDDGKELFSANGKLTIEKLGPFAIWKVTDIQAGRAGETLAPINDDHMSVYTLRGDTLSVAASFDKERENQEPRVDAYKRGKSSKAQAGPDASAALIGTWNLDVELADNNYDYQMRVSREGAALAGVLISPRSGEHKMKTVSFKDGKLMLEIVRDIQGNDTTFVYTGTLKDGTLSGTMTVRGLEDQVSGKWTGKK